MCFVFEDDLVSECGLTDIAPVANTTPAPPSVSCLPPNPALAMTDNRPKYANAVGSSTGRMAASRPSHSAASPESSMTVQSATSVRVSAGDVEVGTLPKLVLSEPTLSVTIIDFTLPWLFWVQRQSKKEELEDISDKLQ